MKTKVPFAGRCAWLCVLITAITCTVAYRLVEMQVVDSAKHGKIAADELISKERIPAQRGIIMDRNEEILTNNIQSAEIVADRYHLRELTAVVEGLAYNQAIHDPRWDMTDDPKARRAIVQGFKSDMLANAERDLTLEEKRALRATIDPKDAQANRRLDYDPEVCAYYFRQHDRLIAEILYPYLRNLQVEDDNADADAPAPRPRTVRRKGKNGKTETVTIAPEPVKKEKKMRPITKEDIIEKIAQTKTEQFNAEAEKKGEKKKSFRNQIVLAKGLTMDEADKVKTALSNARIRGVMVQSDLRRDYVIPDNLCHVLGYVNHENQGMSGVEAYFQSYLAGVDGMREYRHNARGQVLAAEDDRYRAPKHGLNLRLTIDMRLQSIIEQELDKGMRHFRAKRGCMIIVDPKTGDILAMVSRPAFDLNTKELITPDGKFGRGSVKDDKGNPVTGDFNFAVQTRYEPGSTFKVIAVTSAVDKKVLSIHSPISCEPFSVGYGSKPINDRPYNYHTKPMWGVLAKSSNPGAARIAMAAKWPNYKEYLEKFGLTRSAGVDLPSGGACLIGDGSNIVTFSRMAYGYSVAVSPLHMAMVYATIANDGVRMKPRLIDKIISADGSVYDECKPEEVCRVMSPSTAKDLRFALETVTQMHNPNEVNRGTATKAAIPGFRIGGKTGTAKKVKDGGGYYEGLYTVSFAGVLPIDDPKFVIMTVIDEPHPTDCSPGGGTVAAPIFHDAAERIINLLNMQPSNPAAYEAYLKKKAEGATAEEAAKAATADTTKKR